MRTVIAEHVASNHPEEWGWSVDISDASVIKCDLCGKKTYKWYEAYSDYGFLGINPMIVPFDAAFGNRCFTGRAWMQSLDFCKECAPKMVPWFWRLADICLVISEVNNLDRAIKKRIKHGNQNHRTTANCFGKRSEGRIERRP
jgi:hypothetical protein